MKKSVHIEIYSDVICPWCLIGHHRLEQATKILDDIDIEVTWLPFELNPDMPAQGMDRKAYLEDKFGPERAREVYGHIADVLEQEQLGADVSLIKRTPNTFNAHRLVYLARKSGRANDLKLALFNAYFRLGQDIGDKNVLIECAGQAGIGAEQTERWLDSTEGDHETRQLETQAHQIGVSGVPFFILNRKFGISGAQSPQVLAQAISEAAAT